MMMTVFQSAGTWQLTEGHIICFENPEDFTLPLCLYFLAGRWGRKLLLFTREITLFVAENLTLCVKMSYSKIKYTRTRSASLVWYDMSVDHGFSLGKPIEKEDLWNKADVIIVGSICLAFRSYVFFFYN